MRPSSTRKLTPSSATVAPNDLRRPRASMHAMALAFLLLGGIRLGGLRRCGIGRRLVSRAVQEFFGVEAEPLNSCVNPWPFVAKKLLPFALQQQTALAGIDEHAKTATGFHLPLVHHLLIALHNRNSINELILHYMTD